MSTGRSAGESIGIRGYRVRDEAKAEARRRDILLGAARSFVRHGYQAAKLEDIAAESNITKGHIYHYFLNKEQLFTEIVATATDDSVEQLERIVAAGDSPAVTLRKALEKHISVVFEPLEQQANLLVYPPDLAPENRERIRKSQRRYESLIQGVLEDGIAKGVFVAGNPKLMMFTLLRAAVGAAVWFRPSGPWKPEWIVKETADQLMRGILDPGRTSSGQPVSSESGRSNRSEADQLSPDPALA